MELGAAFHGLFDLLPEPMLLVSLEGRVIAVNAALAQRMQAPPLVQDAELREMAADPAAMEDYLRRCAHCGQLLPGSVSLRQADGAVVKYPAAGAAFRFGRSGHASGVLLRLSLAPGFRPGFIALNQEIRELNIEIARRQESEAALEVERQTLQVTLASIGEGVIVTDVRGRITFLNAVAQQMAGQTLDQARGRPLLEVLNIVNEQILAPVEDPFQVVCRSGGIGAVSCQSALIQLDGTILPIEYSAAAIRLEGNTIGAVLTVRDISVRRRNEQALIEADRRKDEFLAMLAHELRNPLAPIGYAAELLSRTMAEDASSRAAVDMIKRQSSQLTRLVDDLLDVSRITQGRIQLQYAPVDLGVAISQAVETVQSQLRDKRQKLAVEVPASDEPLYVEGDLARLVQCFGNVLSNASKYTELGGMISVRTHERDDSIAIEISDTGAGIPPELLPRIFDLFVQSERTLDRSQGGLGIGLAIVKRLIEMHKGNVTARSEGLGHGSTFEIRLPRMIRPNIMAMDTAPLKSRPRRVLVVDDNADAADSLAMLLKYQGHESRVAYSGEEALATAAIFKPDIGLLDIGLPRMNGYELSKQLRAMPQLNGLRLIALTGYAQPEDKRRARAAGFDDHLVKPVRLVALERVLLGNLEEDSTR